MPLRAATLLTVSPPLIRETARFSLRHILRSALSLFSLFALCFVSETMAQAQTTVPFSASFIGANHGTGFDPGPPPTITASAAGTGSGTFGITSVAYSLHLDFSTAIASGTTVYTAGNGDLLFGTLLPYQVYFQPNSTHFTWEGDEVITGGTGLFAGATGATKLMGSGEVLDPNPTTFANTFQDTITGSITLVPEPGMAALLAGTAVFGGSLLLRRRRVQK